MPVSCVNEIDICRIGNGKRSFVSTEGYGPGPAAYDTINSLKRSILKNCPTAKYYEEANKSSYGLDESQGLRKRGRSTS